MPVLFNLQQIIFVTLVFSFEVTTTPCFQLTSQECFTGGDPAAEEGVPSLWSHLDHGDIKLAIVKRPFINLNMFISTDFDALPRMEADCVTIANDTLAEVSSHINRLETMSSSQTASYDSTNLNHWRAQTFFDPCGNTVVRRGGNNASDPWTVFVIPYGFDCAFPADLIITSITMDLFISIEGGAAFVGGADPLAVRAHANFECRIQLGVRMRDGFAEIPCPNQFVDINNPCDLRFTDDKKPVVLQADGCTHVPLEVVWRGLIGPMPYSKFEPQWLSFGQLDCCTALLAMDGMVIPGEVNRISDPGGEQLFGGDVVIMTQESAVSVCV